MSCYITQLQNPHPGQLVRRMDGCMIKKNIFKLWNTLIEFNL